MQEKVSIAMTKNSLSNKSERFFVSQYLQEQIFKFIRDEIPYTTGVIIDSWDEQTSSTNIKACILVDRLSHRAILIGSKGEMIKKIGNPC